MMDFEYFDIHSHISFKDFDEDRDAVIERMRRDGVGTITVGVDLKTSVEAVTSAQKHEGFYATIGLHPTDTVTETFDPELYAEVVAQPKVVGIGECGLDYYRIEGDIEKEKKRQWQEFEKQMAFAIAHDLPLMIHCRPTKGTVDAYEDMLVRLEEEHRRVGDKLRGNMHFFVGDVPTAKRFYQIGFSTSFTGVLTFTHDYDEVVKYAPLDMLMTETDAPYAAPAPFRGKRNEPSYVTYVVAAIAQIRGVPEEGVRSTIVQNVARVFGIS